MGPKAEFTMDPNFERNINNLVRDTLHDVADEQERMLAALSSRFKGQPVAVIKPVLASEWARLGGSITEPDLTEYAQLIHDGTVIRFVVAE